MKKREIHSEGGTSNELERQSQIRPQGAADLAGESGRYYYFCGYGSCQSLYAEWTLAPEELNAEVARVTALLSGAKGYQQFQHGSYICHAIDSEWSRPDTPFQSDSSHHAVTFFAYDPQTGVVRYILCDERIDPDDPPYYMSLDWQQKYLDKTANPGRISPSRHEIQ